MAVLRRLIAAAGTFGVVSALVAACEMPMPYRPLQKPTTQDPDALCAAAVRVFLRKNWGFQQNSCNTEARAVVTKWFKFEDIGIQWPYMGSYRVLVSRGRLEIYTACGCQGDDQRVQTGSDCGCPADQRPPEVTQKEQELANEILAEAHSVAGGKRVRESASGCTKDTDCKGDRICSNGRCMNPGTATQ